MSFFVLLLSTSLFISIDNLLSECQCCDSTCQSSVSMSWMSPRPSLVNSCYSWTAFSTCLVHFITGAVLSHPHLVCLSAWTRPLGRDGKIRRMPTVNSCGKVGSMSLLFFLDLFVFAVWEADMPFSHDNNLILIRQEAQRCWRAELRLAGRTLWPCRFTSIGPLRSFWTDDSLIFSYAGGHQSSCRSSSSRVPGFSLRVSDHLFGVRSSPAEAGGSSRRPPLIDSESWRAKLSGHLRTLGSWRYFCRGAGLAKELRSYADDREQRRTPQTFLMSEDYVLLTEFRGKLCEFGCSVDRHLKLVSINCLLTFTCTRW